MVVIFSKGTMRYCMCISIYLHFSFYRSWNFPWSTLW